MARQFLSYSNAPVETAVIDPKRGNILTQPWERWFDRLKDAMLKRPSCHVSFTSNLSITTTATYQIVLWTAENHDNATMHDASTNTDRLTVPSNGIYAFGVHGIWASDNTGSRLMGITLNDTAIPPTAAAFLVVDGRGSAVPAENYQFASGIRQLSGGDILRCVVIQNSGGALNLSGTDTFGPISNGFWCFKVSI